MDRSTGSRLGPYELVSRIGAGGMGEVFKARDTRLDRPVAIKILPADLAQNVQFRLRFEREAKAISQLNHPNICTLHDVGQEGDESYLVMELLEGESLAERLERGPLPLSEVFRYGAQIAEALDRAHRAGIVHRDLKPGNIMITRSGAKLLDFGLAKSAQVDVAADGATQHKPLTQEGTILGTFQYMAPEQLEGEEADARTDIFALGAVLYEMATGVRAFQGSTKTSLIAAIVSQDPKPLASIQPLTPPGFEHTVNRCMSKHPDDRWQSAHDIAEQLRWIGEAGSQAGVAAPLVARKRSRERLAWSLAALFALTAALAGWLYAQASRDARRDFVWDVMPPQETRFNAVGDEAGAIVVSPDGTKAVFSATGAGTTQLWLRTTATGESKPIAGTQNGSYPFWSPDSRNVGFFALGQLQRTDTISAPQKICPAPSARGGAWSADGTILFAPDTSNAIHRVAANGGTPQIVTKLDIAKHTTHRWPAFLGDGKHFVYFAANHQDASGRDNGIYLGSLEGGDARLLMTSASNAFYVDGHLFFTRGSTLMAQPISDAGQLRGEPIVVANNVLFDSGIWRSAFTVSEEGLLVYHTGQVTMLSALTWYDRSGKILGVVGEPGSYWDHKLSPDGEKLILPVGDPHRQIWVADLKRNTRGRFAIDNAWAGTGVFSPDSSTVYFDASREGTGQVLARRVTGGGETVIAENTEFPVVRTIAPDGSHLLADDRRGRIVRIPLHGSGRVEILTDGSSAEVFPTYSPDGTWIAYMSDQNGRFEIFVRSAAKFDEKWQISSSGGTHPRWSPDGRELYYIDTASRLNAVAIEPAGADLTIGVTTPLFPITGRPLIHPFDVAPDGRFLVNALPEVESPNAVAISNWRRKARK
ncbi:MAG TPA: protein kinase [Thermoanaerobaculia bacterium]